MDGAGLKGLQCLMVSPDALPDGWGKIFKGFVRMIHSMSSKGSLEFISRNFAIAL
jgi:hypothetical protein